MTNSPRWTASPTDTLRVRPGFRLSDVDPRATPGFDEGKSAGRALMARQGDQLSDQQERLYAHGRTGGSRAVLLVLQGMDSSGKGGIARHVLGMVDPQGVRVHGFGAPTDEERRHHYLWRIRRQLPPAGRIGVFDRSHYEDVLIARVHRLVAGDPWQHRFTEINRFEQEAVDAGVVVLKCMLAISPEAQLDRLDKRLTRPDKHWKYHPSDLDERAHWDAYMTAYQQVFDHTATDHAPWFVVPADRKWFARLAITQLLVDALSDLELGWPEPDYDVDHERTRIARARISGERP